MYITFLVEVYFHGPLISIFWCPITTPISLLCDGCPPIVHVHVHIYMCATYCTCGVSVFFKMNVYMCRYLYDITALYTLSTWAEPLLQSVWRQWFIYVETGPSGQPLTRQTQSLQCQNDRWRWAVGIGGECEHYFSMGLMHWCACMYTCTMYMHCHSYV